MRIATILGVTSLGVAIFVALHVVRARRKAGRETVPAREDQPQPAVECEHPVQEPASGEVPHPPDVPPIEVHAPKSAEVAKEVPTPNNGLVPPAESAIRELVQDKVAQTPGASGTAGESEKSREFDPHPEIPPAPAAPTGMEEPAGAAPEGEPTTPAPADSASTGGAGNAALEGSPPAEGHVLPSEPAPLSPEKRGGRSRTRSTDAEQEQTTKLPGKPRPRAQKPEVVCWKREWEWFLGVEVPDELGEVSVSQSERTLTEDEAEKRCWRLAEFDGDVVVSAREDEGERLFKIALSGQSYLAFKLGAIGRDRGRRVERPVCGSYLAVVPADWKRDEESAGPEFTKPENVCLEAYRAHFFRLGDGQTRCAFRDSMSRPHIMNAGEPRFAFAGRELHDASENAGPLFGGPPPRIRVADGNWGNVGTIVFGAEGAGRGRWRDAVKPNSSVTEQELPAGIVSQKAGWYFARFYDQHDDLIDSLDFRSAAGLHEIAIPPVSPLPPAMGHASVTIEFRHDIGWYVRSDPPATEIASVERMDGRTIVTVPGRQEWDQTHWLVGPSGGKQQVEVTLLVERVWWALGTASVPPPQWSDARLALPRTHFAATSEERLWFRLPKPRWPAHLFIGFQRGKSREYAPTVAESTIWIALRDFSDSQELADRTQDHALRVWVQVGTAVYEATVGTVAAETIQTPAPRRIWRCRVPGCRRVTTHRLCPYHRKSPKYARLANPKASLR
jgi:hypothetical protein